MQRRTEHVETKIAAAELGASAFSVANEVQIKFTQKVWSHTGAMLSNEESKALGQ